MERDELVNDDVVVALLVWLGVLTITILATLVALCYHKIKVSKRSLVSVTSRTTV